MFESEEYLFLTCISSKRAEKWLSFYVLKQDYLKELHGALQERLAVVADHNLRDENPDLHLKKLKIAAARLDALVSTLSSDINPMLRHYLERQSYTKALDWLNNTLGKNSA